MCGIAGAVATRPGARVSRERLERISCLLAHRGPDAHGTWAAPSGRAALAHRRLSVIDLATGQTIHHDKAYCKGNGKLYHMPLRVTIRSSVPLDG